MDTLFFRNPRLVVLALFVILAAGLSALVSIGRQEDPTITNIFATITTVLPRRRSGPGRGARHREDRGGAEVDPEIAEIASTSSTAVSVVSIELERRSPTTRIEQVWSEIRDALAMSRDFPRVSFEPEFEQRRRGRLCRDLRRHRRPRPVAGARSRGRPRRWPTPARRAGHQLVDLHGAPEEEVLVTVDPARAASLGLTADAIAAAIRAADAKVQAGRLRGASERPRARPQRGDRRARPPARRGPARGRGRARGAARRHRHRDPRPARTGRGGRDPSTARPRSSSRPSSRTGFRSTAG
jgi:multidrug efflux pump subunit AcrB